MNKIDFSKLETWIHGLFAAAIVSASDTGGAVLGSYVTGGTINWHQLFVSMGISSLLAAFFYLKRSPLPDLGTITISIPPSTSGGTSTTVTTNPDPKA